MDRVRRLIEAQAAYRLSLYGEGGLKGTGGLFL